MDWRRTLPLLLLFLNGWIAIGFMPATFVHPGSLVLFAALTGVGVLSGLSRRREPREAEQNFLAACLVFILIGAIGLAIVVRFYDETLDGGAVFLLVFPLWAIVSGYTVGRFWSVPPMSRPPGHTDNESQPPVDPGMPGSGFDKGAA